MAPRPPPLLRQILRYLPTPLYAPYFSITTFGPSLPFPLIYALIRLSSSSPIFLLYSKSFLNECYKPRSMTRAKPDHKMSFCASETAKKSDFTDDNVW